MYPNNLKLLQRMFFVFVLVVQPFVLNASSCIEKERQALLKLKQGLVDDYGLLSSWDEQEGDTNCCNWWGIQCNNQTAHIEELDLHADDNEQPLRGEITASLTDLQQLIYLDFRWNDFDGKQIPEFIASLTNLRYLDLSHASFSGKIPWQLGMLSSLQVLNLRTNYLTGSIPYQLGNLSNLRELYLFRNNLFGMIPYQLGNLSRLESLSLGLNDNLKIDIQDSKKSSEWISHLSSLTYLNLDGVSNLNKSENWLQTIGQLSKLERLSLEDCSLWDMDLLSLPPSHLNFSNSLTELYVTNNKFTSAIFIWLFNLNSSLSVLYLVGNLLEGPIPSDLGSKMNSLEELYLEINKLNGTIPESIASLSNIKSFSVGQNSMEGVIIDFHPFANLTKLKLLDLSQNSLTLKFSNNWTPKFQLQFLKLQSCKLGPAFPKWLQFQSDVYYLDVANAGISDTATMVSFLCSASESLSFLNLSSNHFTGQLPKCWSHLKSLRILDLSNNELSGSIPNSMGSLVFMRHLVLHDNNFTGELPSLENCTNLILFDVGHNKLFGPIPPWIGSSLHQLQVLGLRSNDFNGSLPLSLCHLTTIQVFDLSMNNLSGQIPNCLEKFSAMVQESNFTKTIDLFYVFKNGSPLYFMYFDFFPLVRWKGKELPFKDDERLLKLIDLSGNQLSGKIPREIGNLTQLVSLDLSSNKLNGQIPIELGKLHDLDFLDLSRNHLCGAIPSSLSEIDRLSVLNLSNNNLSGKIPSGTQLQSFDASTYEGNLYLCGSPLQILCPTENESKDPHYKEEHDDDSYISQGFYISMGLGFVTGFWAIFGPLLFCRCWRHTFFTFLNNLWDKIVVTTTIKLARRRWLRED